MRWHQPLHYPPINCNTQSKYHLIHPFNLSKYRPVSLNTTQSTKLLSNPVHETVTSKLKWPSSLSKYHPATINSVSLSQYHSLSLIYQIAIQSVHMPSSLSTKLSSVMKVLYNQSILYAPVTVYLYQWYKNHSSVINFVSFCPILAWCVALPYAGIISASVPCQQYASLCPTPMLVCVSLCHIVSHFVPCWHCVSLCSILASCLLCPMLALCIFVPCWHCVALCPMLALRTTLFHIGIVSHFVIVSHFAPCWNISVFSHLGKNVKKCQQSLCLFCAKLCLYMYIYINIHTYSVLLLLNTNNLLVLADTFTLFHIVLCFLWILFDVRWSWRV